MLEPATDSTLDRMERGGAVGNKDDEIEHKSTEALDDRISGLVRRNVQKKESENEISSVRGEGAVEEAASNSCLGAIFCNGTTFLVLEIVDGIAVVAGIAMVIFAGIMISSGQVDAVSMGLLTTGAALIIVGVQALIVTHFYSGLFGLNEVVKKLEEENEEYSEENDEHRELNQQQGEQILTLTREVSRYKELNEQQSLQVSSLTVQISKGEALNQEQGAQIERLKEEITRQIRAHESQISSLQSQIEKQQAIYESQVQQIKLLQAESEKHRTLNEGQERQINQLTEQNQSQRDYINRFSSIVSLLQKEGEQFTATGKEIAQVKNGLAQTKEGFDRVLQELDQGVKQGMQTLNQGLNREIGVFRRLHERLEILEVRLRYLEENYRETYMEVLRNCPSPVTAAAAAKPAAAAQSKDSL